MSKDFIKFSLAFVFLSGVLGGCANAQTIVSPTDEAVLEQFGKLRNEKFGKDDVCIKRLKESAKIIVIGLFVKDLGCCSLKIKCRNNRGFAACCAERLCLAVRFSHKIEAAPRARAAQPRRRLRHPVGKDAPRPNSKRA